MLDSSARPDAELPLYLLVALEELSLFGSFADLDARIDALPPQTPELFDQVLSRLHHDHGGMATELVLRALAASRAGLLESEVLGLFGNRAGLTPIRWGYLYRALEPYLQPLDERTRTGLLGFAHNQVREAVHRRYFEVAGPKGDPRGALEATHGELADFFAAGRAPDAPEWASAPLRALSEWPFHLAGAMRQTELRAALTALPFLQAKTASLGPRPLLADYDLATGHEKGDEALARLRRAIRLSAQILHDDPDELVPQLCARLGRDASGPMASLWRQIDEMPRTWLRPRLRTADPGNGRELGRLRGINMLHCLAASPDGRLAATGAERGSIEVWDLTTAVRRRLITSDEGWMSAAVGHPHEPVAYVGATSGNVYRVDLVAGIITHQLGDFHVAKKWSMPSFGDPDPTVRGLDVSADGSLLVVGHEDGTARLWDTLTHREVREIGTEFGEDNPLRSVAMRPTGDGLLCVGDHLDLLDLDGALVLRLTWTDAGADAVACSSSLAATGHDDGAIRLWDLADPGNVEVLPRHRTGRRQGVTALAFNASGDRLVSVGADKRLCVTALPGGASVLDLGAHSMTAYDVALLDDGRRALTCGKDSLLKTWDLTPGGGGAAAVPELEGEPHPGSVETVAVADDGGTAVSGGTDGIRVWDVDGRRLVRKLAGHGGESVVAVAISTTDREIRSLGQDGFMRRWNLDRGRQGTSTRVAKEGPWEDVALRADGHEALVVRSPTHRTASLAILRHGRSRASRVVPLGDGKPTEVAISPTGRLALVVDLGGRLTLIDLSGRRPLWTSDLHPGHADFVVSMVIAADERFAVLGLRRGAVEAWDLTEGTRLHRSEFHVEMVEDVALTGDGELTCSASWETLRLWHTRTGNVVASFHGEYDWSSCAITPDGTTVVAGDTNGTVHFLEVVNADRLASLTSTSHGRVDGSG